MMRTTIAPGLFVSTAYVGGRFETMIFKDGVEDAGSTRYHDTLKEATAAHHRAVGVVESVISKHVRYNARGRRIVTCSACGKRVNIDKPLFGSLHICE